MISTLNVSLGSSLRDENFAWQQKACDNDNNSLEACSWTQ